MRESQLPQQQASQEAVVHAAPSEFPAIRPVLRAFEGHGEEQRVSQALQEPGLPGEVWIGAKAVAKALRELHGDGQVPQKAGAESAAQESEERAANAAVRAEKMQ